MFWYYVISLRSGHVIEPLAFDEGSYKIKEEYNLHGRKITSTSLTWDPFLSIEDCNEDGLGLYSIEFHKTYQQNVRQKCLLKTHVSPFSTIDSIENSLEIQLN